jgi:hypothetical protein
MSDSVRRSVSREIGAFVTNLLSCISMFSLLWVVIEYPGSLSSFEPVVGLMFVCLFYLPLAFALLYAPLKIVGTRLHGRSILRRYLLDSWWACGVLGGGCLILAYYHTALFRLLTPMVKVFI